LTDRVPIFHVDAFTDKPFAGNPAAVCLLTEERSGRWMQSVAAEMNLPETAFVRKLEEGYELRWFTPTVEVELCGHATLASAHILWDQGFMREDDPIRFYTRSGVLTCNRAAETIELNFPATPPIEAVPPAGLLEAFRIQPSFVGRSTNDLLLVVESEQISELEPDLHALRGIAGIRGVIVSGPSTDPRFDFISRFFAPAAGIDEDPVTGSAHCCLGPYWSARLGKRTMTAYQASKRGGVLHVTVEGDRVILGGSAVTILQGELFKSEKW